MESDRRALLNQILEYHFACIELNLYLDNNPDDEDALCEYNMYFEKFQDAKYEYEDRYGPLTNFGYVPDCYQWEWVDNPWPWVMSFINRNKVKNIKIKGGINRCGFIKKH